MAGIEGLGRVFNVIPVAAGVSVSLKQAAGVTFVAYGAAEAFTLSSQVTSGGAKTALPSVTRYYLTTSDAGAAAWTDVTQAAASTVTLAGAADAAAVYVDASDLPAGAAYAVLDHTTAGLVVAIIHNLQSERDPANLPVPSA